MIGVIIALALILLLFFIIGVIHDEMIKNFNNLSEEKNTFPYSKKGKN